MASIVKVETKGEDLDNALILFKEYFEELNENLCFQNFDAELKDPLKKYGPASGCLFVAYVKNTPAGCIAFQSIKTLDADDTKLCEMKRLYVRPSYRKNKIGDELVKLLLSEAKSKGYKKMVLDTLERLQPAINLYRRYGFNNTTAYYDNPLPGVVYMERLV